MQEPSHPNWMANPNCTYKSANVDLWIYKRMQQRHRFWFVHQTDQWSFEAGQWWSDRFGGGRTKNDFGSKFPISIHPSIQSKWKRSLTFSNCSGCSSKVVHFLITVCLEFSGLSGRTFNNIHRSLIRERLGNKYWELYWRLIREERACMSACMYKLRLA